jgi:hypothetical protein
MKTSSAKSKGRLLQKKVRDAILETYKELTPNDVRSTSMGASGVDVLLSERAMDYFPYSVECKNRARIAVYDWWLQCACNVHPNTQPLMVIKQNHSDPLVIITLDHFMELSSRSHN